MGDCTHIHTCTTVIRPSDGPINCKLPACLPHNVSVYLMVNRCRVTIKEPQKQLFQEENLEFTITINQGLLYW